MKTTTGEEKKGGENSWILMGGKCHVPVKTLFWESFRSPIKIINWNIIEQYMRVRRTVSWRITFHLINPVQACIFCAVALTHNSINSASKYVVTHHWPGQCTGEVLQ